MTYRHWSNVDMDKVAAQVAPECTDENGHVTMRSAVKGLVKELLIKHAMYVRAKQRISVAGDALNRNREE